MCFFTLCEGIKCVYPGCHPWQIIHTAPTQGFTHAHQANTHTITGDLTYQEALIECHGSLHWSACVLEIELVGYTDTQQDWIEDRTAGNEIGESEREARGGRMGEGEKWAGK